VSTAVECDWPVHEAIVRGAQAARADLIVAECHAGRHFAPWLLRLTDWELLRYSPVPVLLVKDKRPYKNPVLLAAVDPTHASAKPSKLDDDILDAASKLRAALRGTLHVMHAFIPLPTDATHAELLDEHAAERLEARARRHAGVGFERVLKNAGISGAPSRRHLVGLHPINAIPDLARRTRSAIVVMGAVSRSGLKQVFIGNTAERALDDLPCDVLVVKPRQFVSKVARARRPTRIVPAPMLLPY
jgi:universal stress protein E